MTTALSTIDEGNPSCRLAVLHPAAPSHGRGDVVAAPSPVRVLIADGQALVRALIDQAAATQPGLWDRERAVSDLAR